MIRWFSKERFELEQTILRPNSDREFSYSISHEKEREAYMKDIMSGLEHILNPPSRELLLDLANEGEEGATILQLPKRIQIGDNNASQNYLEVSTGSDKRSLCLELKRDRENKLYVARPERVGSIVHLHIAADTECNRAKTSKEFSKWTAEQLLKFGHMRLVTKFDSRRIPEDLYAIISGEYLHHAYKLAVEKMISQRIILAGSKINIVEQRKIKSPVFFGLEQNYSNKGFVNKVTRYLPETLR